MNLSMDQPIRYHGEYFCLRLCKLISSRETYTSTKFLFTKTHELYNCLTDIYSSYLYSFPVATWNKSSQPWWLKTMKIYSLMVLEVTSLKSEWCAFQRLLGRLLTQGVFLFLLVSGDSRNWLVATPYSIFPWPSFLCLFSSVSYKDTCHWI